MVQRIREYPAPSSLRELKSFLGLVNYYRNFINKFSDTASPLYELTQKNSTWKWGDGQETSFQSLRSALVSESVCLRFPQWNRTFYVECDASKEGVGAVLSQDDNEGIRRPISFFSSRLNKSQINYSASELETWAIVAATRKWRKYLQAASAVEIWTDHNALQWLRRQKDPRGKFSRWLIELQSINYNIIYRKGKDNILADHLSRFPGQLDEDINEERECFERFLYPIDNICPSDEMALKQSEDPVIANAKYQLAAQKLVTDGPLKNQSNLRIVGDRLYRGRQFVVPESMREPILSSAHKRSHAGISRTFSEISKRYYWPSMWKDIRKHCGSCLTCLRNKRAYKKERTLSTSENSS